MYKHRTRNGATYKTPFLGFLRDLVQDRDRARRQHFDS